MSLRTSVGERKEIFRKLVQLQDEGIGVPASKSRVSKQFNKTVYFVQQVEDEGINRNWLDEIDDPLKPDKPTLLEQHRQALASKWTWRLKEGRQP